MSTVLLSILILAIILEGTIATLPLVLIFLLCLTILKKDTGVFLTVFLAGIFLDLFRLNTLGASSIFFVIFVFLVFLYQRKYEIDSYPFLIAAAFFGTLIYSWIFGYGNIILLAMFSTFIASLLFIALRKLPISTT